MLNWKANNMEIRLRRLTEEQIIAFKEEMQEAFLNGFNSYKHDGEDTNNVWQKLPDKDFYESMNAEGAEAYEAIDEFGNRVGGTILKINNQTHHNELAFLYVKVGEQSKGVGLAIWNAIEQLHPETEVWSTATPYFDVRNVHFYINRCGFHVVEFFNAHHPDPNLPGHLDQADGLFEFQKVMK